MIGKGSVPTVIPWDMRKPPGGWDGWRPWVPFNGFRALGTVVYSHPLVEVWSRQSPEHGIWKLEPLCCDPAMNVADLWWRPVPLPPVVEKVSEVTIH